MLINFIRNYLRTLQALSVQEVVLTVSASKQGGERKVLIKFIQNCPKSPLCKEMVPSKVAFLYLNNSLPVLVRRY